MEIKLLAWHPSSYILLLVSMLTLIISYKSTEIHCLAAVNDNNSNDRLALIAFKREITQDPLGILSSWNNRSNSLHLCEWRGVTCSGSRVSVLDLNSQGLVGSISPYIGNLSFLKDFFLYNNSLNGELPQQIGRLLRLKRIDLSYNFLKGEIPENISNCSNLRNLELSHNKLVGSIPHKLGSFHNLITLGLHDNNLSGEIPSSLGNLSSSLTVLDVGYNFNLKGRIPSTLSQLTSLKILGLDSNKFSGIVPSSLYNISSSLEVFSLMDNQLHGSIPSDIGSTLPNLTYFSVAVNNFTGTIPSSFSNMSKLEKLQLGTNNFVGSVPLKFGNLKSLKVFRLRENNLGSRQANDLNFLDSLVNCTNLKVIEVSYNNFGGVLPISIANLTTNLVELNIRRNQIYGSIPKGIQNLVGLSTLILGLNQLTGSIPPGIGHLQNMGMLGLAENKLSGSIPSSFGNLTRLIELYLNDNKLTGLIPSSLGDCNFLQILVLHTNRLSGSIPKQVFQLPSLSRLLDLSNNSLTGSLPLEVSNFKSLGVLILSNNKLSGEIPSIIGECLSLSELRLDGNLFQGNIPPAISSLKGLQSLRLSHNNLSGTIPKGLENLTTLTELDLSYNNLEGAVPKEGVFKNMTAFSIKGSNELCGGVPDLKLPDCPILLKQKQGKSMHIKVIVITIVFVIMFLTLIMFFVAFYWRKQSKSVLPIMPLDVSIRFKGVSYNELFKATNGFNDSTNLLGKGSFGSVYKGVLQDESNPVAVKVLHLQQRGATKSFIAECDALRKVRHRNLLRILTCCSSNDFKALVFKFMANGSLENWLHPTMSDTNNNDQLQVKNLNLKRRLNIAVDVASAVKYLHHDCESPLVHCDLKPSNVLLDDDLVARVGDFGLAKFLPHTSNDSRQLNGQDASSIAIKGSIGYVSPEYGMGGEVSTLGDVYSYGILLLEMFTGKRPTDDMFKDGLDIHNFSKMHAFPERVLDIVDSRLLLELDGEDLHNNETNNYNMRRCERRNRERHTTRKILASIIEIGVICSSELPSDRINMNEILVDVQAVKNQFLGIGM